MSVVAFIRRMLDAGFTHEDALRAAEAFEATAGDMIDVQAERRREKDRERKRAKAFLRNSAESAETEETLSPSPSPQTPQPRPHTRGDISSRARKGRPGDPVGFDEFWAIYPNRAARKNAVRAFAKALDAIPDEDALAVILAGVRRALPGWDGTETRFIPHAASWLNAERWNDPPPPPRHSPTSRTDDRQSSRPSKLDHLADVFGAMGIADEFRPDHRGDQGVPCIEGSVRVLPPAA